MAKQNNNNRSTSHFINLIAFIGIILGAIAWALSFIFSKLDLSSVLVGWLDTAAKILMTIVALVVAHKYVRNRRNVALHVIYWICAAVAITFSILLVVL